MRQGAAPLPAALADSSMVACLLPSMASCHQVVRVDRRKAGGEHTDTIPLDGGHLPARRPAPSLCMACRTATLPPLHRPARCPRLQSGCVARVLSRHRAALSQRLFAACPAFAAPLAQAGALLDQLRGTRAVHVRAGLSSAADWGEQQAAWRARKATPALESAAVGFAA